MTRRMLSCVTALLLAGAWPPAGARAQAPQALPGLEGIDHVAIGVNELRGAVAAYERLGFEVVRTADSVPGSVGAFVDLGDEYLALVSPQDSAGTLSPYAFEGALGQAWRVRDAEAAAAALSSRGFEVDRPQTAGGSITAVAIPSPQPVAGTEVALVQIDRAARQRMLRSLAGIAAESAEEPEDHSNGAIGLAYVTVAVRRTEETVKLLRRWGLEPAKPASDSRGASSLRVDLPSGILFLVAPMGGGGINDFLEERRARAAPVGDRYYEGSILSVGIAVEDLDHTVAFLNERGVPHVPMELPVFGRTEVVQGAPGWGLRVEFVESPAERPAGGASTSGAPASESESSCVGPEECE